MGIFINTLSYYLFCSLQLLLLHFLHDDGVGAVPAPAGLVGCKDRKDFDLFTRSGVHDGRIWVELMNTNQKRVIHNTDIRQEVCIIHQLSLQAGPVARTDLEIPLRLEFCLFPCRSWMLPLFFADLAIDHRAFQVELVVDLEPNRENVIHDDETDRPAHRGL